MSPAFRTAEGSGALRVIAPEMVRAGGPVCVETADFLLAAYRRALGPLQLDAPEARAIPHPPMGSDWETTRSDEEHSSVGQARVPLWLCWLFPVLREPIAIEHGLVAGRDEECQSKLNGSGTSRRHVEFQRQGPLFALSDLRSTNGTYLNGKRVEHGPALPGGVLRIGDQLGIFVASPEPPQFREVAPGVLGGAEMEAALRAMRSAASSDIPMVVVGATGTGKERVASAIHQLSGRTGAFHAINCASLPDSLAEAELFGYRKGAFTGAERASAGHIRAAHGGTLFLDEVAELPLRLQAKLLRAIELQQVIPLGETEAVSVDVRIVAATQKPLRDLVTAQSFRDDLAARLSGLTISLPSLRERRGDIPALFAHFVRRYSGGRPPSMDVRLLEGLCLHDWPHNVRELEHLARQVLAVHGHAATLRRSMLPAEVLATLPSGIEPERPPATPIALPRRVHDEQRLAAELLRNNGNVASAAAALGFSKQRAYRLLNGQKPLAFAERHAPVSRGLTSGERGT